MSPIESKANIGLKLHVTDVFLEEFAKVAEEKLSPDSLDTVLEPFLTAVKTAEEGEQVPGTHRGENLQTSVAPEGPGDQVGGRGV